MKGIIDALVCVWLTGPCSNHSHTFLSLPFFCVCKRLRRILFAGLSRTRKPEGKVKNLNGKRNSLGINLKNYEMTSMFYTWTVILTQADMAAMITDAQFAHTWCCWWVQSVHKGCWLVLWSSLIGRVWAHLRLSVFALLEWVCFGRFWEGDER